MEFDVVMLQFYSALDCLICDKLTGSFGPYHLNDSCIN